jgi:hypothetical protein
MTDLRLRSHAHCPSRRAGSPLSNLGAMTRPDFSITVSGSPGHPILQVSGELDHRNGPALTERVHEILHEQPSHLTLDASTPRPGSMLGVHADHQFPVGGPGCV